MKRKVSRMGPASLVVSLPSKWVKKYTIQKGDEIEAVEHGSTISFSIDSKKDSKRTSELDASGSYFSDLYINYSYRAGFDEIHISYADSAVFTKIQNRVQTLIGYEVMDQQQDSCLIKIVSAPLQSEFEAFFRKLMMTTLTMGDSLLDVLQEGDLKKLEEIRLIEKTNNTFFEFIQKMLHNEDFGDQKKILSLQSISREFERIADYYKYMIDYLLQSKKETIGNKTLKFFEEVAKYIRAFYELFYAYKIEGLHALSKKRYALVDTGYGVYQKANQAEGMILMHLLSTVQLIFDLLGPLYIFNEVGQESH